MEGTKIKMANPAPLGLLSFGMTTVLLNLHNAQFIDLSVMIVAMGLALGGFAQIIAGVFELKQGNTFGGTAFVAYGSFWWSLIFIWLNPVGEMDYADEMSMGFYLLLWGIFSLCMFIATLKHFRALQVVFLTLVVLFFGLALSDFLVDDTIRMITGFVGIFCGGSAMYTSMGLLLKEEYGKTILPLGEKQQAS
jgi:succinate-acetate transporter protein